MKTNMGFADKALRILAAVAIVVIYLVGLVSGAIATVLLIVAGIFILTSMVSFCPLYYPFGINTKPREKR
ncbi:MAG: YgaP family membrane protein [Mucilaginibacter sp.]